MRHGLRIDYATLINLKFFSQKTEFSQRNTQ